ncbi:glucosyltransferase involved in LPS biosynthesis [Candidatus Phytoplasma mali]|uniref:Glucosyltransferase involved in LPS biosynthesis n=1 Tax=Phytoplasma mali (strain AT) TaxID=482235 RepID=B3R0A6_PHYMT|nr:glycosyltransferase [Candidatus Phytoplasma mali]CAP18270.1 glucosyltransferase involved in LPS biosynthesis [Candidatus Phytoplasma mali]
MRIGFFIDGYEPLIGGVIVSAKALKEILESFGHEVYIITVDNSKKVKISQSYIIRLPGIRIPLKQFSGYYFILRYKKYLSLIAELNLDIIHIHTEFSMGKLGLYAHQKLKISTVYTLHSFYDLLINKVFYKWPQFFKNFGFRQIRKLHYKFISQSNVVILPSLKTLQHCKNKYKIKGDYHIIPTQLNLSQFYSENYASDKITCLRQKLNLTNMFVCLYVGRLSEEKEVDYLIRVFSFFILDNPLSKFLIIGDGPIRNKLEQQVKKLNIIEHVIFVGFIPYKELGLYYQLGNVFLSASLFETQGLTYIEALAASLPLVARYDAVLENVLLHGKNGFFFTSPKELINILTDLYHHPIKCQTLSQQAKLSILKYNSEDFAKKVLDVYRKAIKKSSTKFLIS